MAKKSSQKRLTIPFDLWELAKFYEFDRHEFAFFISKDTRVVILPIASKSSSNLECIGKCVIDEKHRVLIPKNVDTFLGEGNEYYFTIEKLSCTNDCNPVILYKVDKSAQELRQNYHIKMLLESLN